jgi:hypothetical protein
MTARRLITLGLVGLVAIAAPWALGDDRLVATVEPSADEITVADRVTLVVRLRADARLAVEPWVDAARAAFEEAGWTVVSISADPPQIEPSGAVRHEARVVLEPFLPGSYRVPALTWSAAGALDDRATASSPEAEIVVRSLLPEDEAVDLPIGRKPWEEAADPAGDAPLGATRPVPELAEPVPAWWYAAGVGGLLGAAFLVRLTLSRTRRSRGDAGRDGWADLATLASHPAGASPASVDRSLRAGLAGRLGPAAFALAPADAEEALRSAGVAPEAARRVSALLAALESARYAPGGRGHDARSLAAEAARLAPSVRGGGA